MRLVMVIGAPAVGKATVGRELAERYGFKLFHNHVSLDMVTAVFDWGTPAFSRLVSEVRTRVIEEAAEAGIDLVFTYVWSFSEPDDGAPLRAYRDIVLNAGGEVFFVELVADANIRQERNGMASRRAMKRRSDEASTPEWIAEVDAAHSFDSGGRLPFDEPQIRVDVTSLPPGEAADRIAAKFGFERRED